MKNKIIRIISLLIIVCLNFNIIGCQQGKDDGGITSGDQIEVPQTTPSEGLEYILSEDEKEYYVNGIGTCKDASITIPNKYMDLPVTMINDNAFLDNKQITELIISEGVYRLGENAFRNCDNLEIVYVCKGVNVIQSSTFTDCDKLKSFFVDSENYRYTSKDGHLYSKELMTLVKYASGCQKTSFEMPKNVKYVDKDAFFGADALENVYFQGTLEDWCSIQFLETFSNPMSVAEHFFLKSKDGYEEVTEIELKNVGSEIKSYQFQGFENLKKVIVSDGVETISRFAFYHSAAIENVIVNENVKTIDTGAFAGCINIKSITLPFIGNQVDDSYGRFNVIFRDYFDNAQSKVVPSTLEEVIITSGTIIRKGAFGDCENLKRIVVPNELSYIDDLVFKNIEALETNNYDSGRYIGSKENPYLILIDTLSDDIKTCEIHPNTKFIYDSAFFNKTNLTEIVIPDKVEFIGSGVFCECTSLHTIEISKSVKHVGDYVLDSTNSLEKIYYNGTFVDWLEIDFGEEIRLDYNPPIQEFYMKNESNEYYLIENITIPNTLKQIKNSQFNLFTKTNYIIIPEEVENIDPMAFYNCENLILLFEESDEPFNWNQISSNFSGTAYFGVTGDGFYENDGKRYILNKNTKEAILLACNTDTTKVVIEEYITVDNIKYEIVEIIRGALENLSNIESLTLPFVSKMNEDYGFKFGNLFTKRTESLNSTFNVNELVPETLKELIISKGTLIPRSCFEKCYNLEKVVLPNTLEVIKNSAFFSCWMLETITIPNSVTSIGNYAFEWCDSLTSIVIPNSVTSIGNSAFSFCRNLQKVFIKNDFMNAAENRSFVGCNNVRFFFEADVKPIGWDDFWAADIPACWNAAEEYFYEEGNFLYLLDYRTKEAKVIEYIKEDVDLEIKRTLTVDGIDFLVTSVMSGVFLEDDFEDGLVKSITIPSSILLYEEDAFLYGDIETVYYQGSMESWFDLKFENICSNPSGLGTIYFLNSENEYYIPTEIITPSNVTSIGDYQFVGFRHIQRVEISDNIKSIGEGAFYNLNQENIIFVPDSVEEIKKNAFYSSYDSFILFEHETQPEDWVMDFFNNNDDTLILWGVTTDEIYCYNECMYLLNHDVKEAALVVCIPTSNQLVISGFLYEGVEYNVTSILGRPFAHDFEVNDVYLPKTIKNYDFNTFGGRTNLENIYFDGTIEDWCNIVFKDEYSNPMYHAEHFYLLDENNEYYELIDLVIPDSVTVINAYQFLGFDNIKSVIFNRNVTEIKRMAFSRCVNLETAIIPNSVAVILYNVFLKCNKLTAYCEARYKPLEWNSYWNPDGKYLFGVNIDEYLK